MDLRLQNPNSPKEVDDLGARGLAMATLSGRIHPFLKWQVGFQGSFGPTIGNESTASVTLLDLVTKVEILPELNLWMGRMPIPSDRTSLSSEWAIAPWMLPGVYGFYVVPIQAGVRTGQNHRGDGITLWGQLGDGRFKYYAGAFDLDQPKGSSPLISGRLSLNLLDHESGYRTSSSYYGSKRILSLGVGAQHKANGSSGAGPLLTASDFSAFCADVLLEIGNAHTGVLDLEGAFTKTWGDYESTSYQSLGLVSYLLPIEIGVGRFQPLVRVQHAGAGSTADAGDVTSIDTQLGYIIDGLNARALLLYNYTKLPTKTQNAVVFAVQLLTRGK